MKATAERSSVTVSRSPDAKARPFFAAVQTKLTVNAPGDKHEKEADATADRVMRMSDGQADEKLQKVEAAGGQPGADRAQRAANGTPVVTDGVHSAIRSQQAGGHRLDPGTQHFMESRFRADFSQVRVHDDAESAQLSRRLGARAFTTGGHVFFGAEQYRPGSSEGRHLLAHELTHAIQQGAAIQRSPLVSTTSAVPAIQRLGIGDALDYFADKANFLPGFRMLTVVLGFNPINMAAVDRSAGNILRALIELLPGATLITAALERHGVFERAGAWVQAQLAAFGNVGSQIRRGIDAFLGSLSWRDIFDLAGVWERAKSIFTSPVANLIAFAGGLLTGLMDLVRDAILRPLAALLRPTRGYDLLCPVLGRDPVTGDRVPRTADTVIGGFMKLIRREDIWDNIKKGNAVARAWAWFQGALAGLSAFVTSIPDQVLGTLRSITWQDVVTITGVFGKVVRLFANVARQFIDWASGTVLELLEIIFSVVAPGVIPYVKKAQAAFRAILDNPIGFVGQLVRAGRLGFELFASNILTHLKAALIKWIVGPLADAGVYIPQSFSLVEIVKLVLSVLGLTWQSVRAKLVKIIPEPVLAVLEKTASILVTLVKDGPAAAWEQIKAELSELKSMLIDEVTSLVRVEVVKAAVTKIATMLNPAGAVIQAILAIYNTIMFFVERISQIAATVAAFVDSIAAIAAGQVTAAAQKVERTLANTLVVVISFLARLVGLGGIPQKIVGIVRRIRQPIDKGMDRVVAWLGAMLKKLAGAVKGAAAGFLNWWKKSAPVTGPGVSHSLKFQGEGATATLVVQSQPKTPEEFVIDFQPSPGKKAEVAKRKAAVADLAKQVAAAQGKIPPDEASIQALDAKLTIEFNHLGALLSSLIAGTGEEGTAARPLPIDYPKRRASAYVNMYVGPKTKQPVRQSALRIAAAMSPVKAKKHLAEHNSSLKKEGGFIAWSGTVRVYSAAGGPSQSIEGGPVGLEEAFASLAPGKLLVYDEKGSTGGGGKINAVFEPFGFRPREEAHDGDHVLERQLGGPDRIGNLWPLDKSENRSSGSTIRNTKVTFRGKQVTVHEARERRPDKPLHLLVRSTKS